MIHTLLTESVTGKTYGHPSNIGIIFFHFEIQTLSNTLQLRKNVHQTTGKTFLIALRPATLLKRTPAQEFPYEFREIFKNIYFVEYLQMSASEE